MRIGSEPAAELWLVRHGETEWSASGRHTSRTDVELTEAGRRDAAALRARLLGLDFARVLTSPRRRARVTADLAGFGDRAEEAQDLVEWDYGRDEGLTTPEIRRDRPGWSVWRDGPLGGESAEDVRRRVDRVVALALAVERPVLAFSHGHLCRAIGARWIGLDVADGARLKVAAGAICVLGHERDTPAVERWNDTGHLA
ncbi:MAG: histidine phosphatase family protein [Actinomycetes bacterium]